MVKDEKDELFEYVVMKVDGREFELDKADVWNLFCLSQTYFDSMKDPDTTKINREKVMEKHRK